MPSRAGGPMRRLRCTRHSEREAAACCAECGLPFCRECVSEYEGRLLCAACLEKIVANAKADADGSNRGLFALTADSVKRAASLAAGVAWLWLCFYLAGLLIEKLPQSVHEGTVWAQAAEEALGEE
ncbi:hypothetical protein M2103_001744 [Ereboglobus sp. PH5-5]|uniref:hypothetical protein n=1 Tax=Ereboglobus sp. PH5-5 TaxID=2940529 RepID=UPI00240749B0|nr:hypothetical protein [Ereboglobus sp. PH5-5]MDF9833517.1 hypothetical protein [Ereboglobus sp. PH5-5]